MFTLYVMEGYIGFMVHCSDRNILFEENVVVRIIQQSYNYPVYELTLPFLENPRQIQGASYLTLFISYMITGEVVCVIFDVEICNMCKE